MRRRVTALSHRPRSRTSGRGALALALALTGLVTAGCGSPPDDRVPGPRLLEAFTPEVVGDLTVDTEGFDATEIDLRVGDALELTNDGDAPVRVRGHIDGDQRYDTGTVEPGATTVLGFTTTGTVVFTLDDAEDARSGNGSGAEVVVTVTEYLPTR